MFTQQLKNIYLSIEEFDSGLETFLIILEYPSRNKQYYVCEYTYESGKKETVIVHIIKY